MRWRFATNCCPEMAVTPSDQRLHPLTVLFALGGELRRFLVPAILATMTARQGAGTERFLFVFFVPAAILAVVRYLFSTYRYDETELVVRTGIIFRNERHIPYARIQSVDAVQNLLHRWLSVVDVKVQTATGGEAEATLSVLPMSALEDMRERVFAGRRQALPVIQAVDEQEGLGAAPQVPAVPTRSLLHLSPRDLALSGLFDNRGWVVIGAAWGLMWETGVMDRFEDLDLATWPLYVSGVLGLFVVAPLLSTVWAIVRLHGFELKQNNGDLRVSYGALTHVTATIPLRRVQAIKIKRNPGHRWTGRASVRVETAGGDPTGKAGSEREWIAPIIRMTDLPALVATVLPGIDLTALSWQPVDPRAFGRRRNLALIWAAFLGGVTAPWVGTWWSLGVALALAAWGMVASRLYVKSLGWARTEQVIAFRSGWIRRAITIVPLEKIQVVDFEESPFDRRWQMACLRVDTAGAGAHRIDIPYLSRQTAEDARLSLAERAAATTFRW
ncbi:MAG: PH domain-containing protein [Acidobacteria bacterium]|jgi:putative membrane protein|nr:PH domain-containing protein [Acidobacteriota bacterium]